MAASADDIDISITASMRREAQTKIDSADAHIINTLLTSHMLRLAGRARGLTGLRISSRQDEVLPATRSLLLSRLSERLWVTSHKNTCDRMERYCFI